MLDGKEATEANRRDAVGEVSCRLWNDVEQFEDAHNRHAMRARLAGKVHFALPVELSREAQLELGRSFVKNSLAGRGGVVDWVRHDPEPNDKGQINPHLHATVTLRHAERNGWGLKNRVWDRRGLVRTLRAEWAREANIALEKAGRPERIDHRKLVDQGIELEATSYDRTLALALEARGEQLRRKIKAQDALEANREYLKNDPEHILAVVSAERTVFSQSDVRDAFRRQGFDASAAKLLTTRAMQSFELIGLVDDMGTGERLHVTRAQLHVEANLMAEALEMAGSDVTLPDEAASVSVPKGLVDGLDTGQKAAFDEMISTKRLALVSGFAGAGKTWAVSAAAQVWKARGFEVLGGAISGRATQGLSGIEGMRVASLASWEARWALGDVPEYGRFVLFVDEAGMVGTATWARVQHQVARMGGLLRPVGDREQLQPTLDTGVYGQLLARIGGAVIHNVRRMRDEGDREATKLFAQGVDGGKAALDHYRNKGAVQELPTVGTALAALVDAYYAPPGQVQQQGATAAPGTLQPDLIDSGIGPIVLPLAAAGKDEQKAKSGAQGGLPNKAPQPSQGKRTRKQTQGPSKAAVREALLERAEDLFRTVFGEPVRPNAKEWRARTKASRGMRMQGPGRGEWFDFSAEQGGDLFELFAREFCGLSSAKSDFPRVLKEAARYCGVATDQPVDESVLQARAAARQREAEKAAKQEAARRAALVKTLVGRAVPMDAKSPAAVYLAGRGVTEVPDGEVGWLPPVPGEAVKSPEFGALVVWARNAAGDITGGQRILLNPDGTKANRTVKKPSFGAIGGSHARFPAREQAGPRPPFPAAAQPASLRDGAENEKKPLVIAEGPESALSIWQATGYETWAVFGASNWRNVELPADRPVILAPDRDAPDSPAGRAFRKAVVHHLKEMDAARAGGSLSIAVAPEPAGSKCDLNDTDQRAGPEAVRAAIAAARPVVVQGAVPPEANAAKAPATSASQTQAAGPAPSGSAALAAPSPVSVVPVDPEPTRIAVCYTRRDVDMANDALRARALRTGRVWWSEEINYGKIVRLDRRGLVPKRYTAPMLFAPGDRVVFTKPHRELEIAKSSFATVTATHPGKLELELDGGREVEIDITRFDHFDYGYAATAHQAQGMTVDQAYAFAHPRMNRPVTHVMMTRHQDSVQMFVPQSRFRDVSFEDVASRDDYLELGWEGERAVPVAGRSFGDTAHGSRPDRVLREDQDAAPISGVSYLRDPHLLSVMRRVAGLLSSEWAEGDPILGEDAKGYAAEPQRVIEDLVARHSVIRADMVAEDLARTAPHPDTFVRLFREAMAHPDLVALTGGSEAGSRGSGRVYSTGTQVELELAALDLGVTLAAAHRDKGLTLPEASVDEALARAGLDATARDAALHGAQSGQLQLISGGSGSTAGLRVAETSQIRLITGGAGSGKTAVLAALADAHEIAAERAVPGADAALTVHRIAPTRNAGRAFAEAADAPVRAFRSFLHGLETGDVTLDANSVIVLDEAGLMEIGETYDLLDVIEMSGARLIAAWDPAQVGRGRVFDDLEARIGSVRLAGGHRQKTKRAREIIQSLDEGSARQSAERLIAAGVVESAKDRDAAVDQLVDGYLADRSPDRIIVTATRAEAAEVNQAIQARLHPQNAGQAASSANTGPAGSAPSPAQTSPAQPGSAQSSTQTPAPPPAQPVDPYIPVADLHEGDQVVLSAWYAPARLPAGTRGVVVRADADEVRIRLGEQTELPADPANPNAERHVVVRRDDAEFRCGLRFAQTVYEAKGQGHSSVHVLGRRGLTREMLTTAMGLHEKKLRLVLPGKADKTVEVLSGIFGRSGQKGRVAEHVLDPALARAAVSDEIASLRKHARGTGSPWVKLEDVATVEVTEGELIADPACILRVIAAKRARFTLGDVRREIAARVSGEDVDALVSRAMGSEEIVWLTESTSDGSPLFTTRANENAAYLLARPEHILTLMGAERTVFTLDDLGRAFERRLPQEDSAALLEQVTASPPNVGFDALVALEAWGPGGDQLFTTRAHIATEQALVAQAKDMATRQLSWDAGAPAQGLPPAITGAQRRAGEAMLDESGLVLVRGVAGSGKTTVLREVASIWRARGFDVCGGALDARAAGELGDGVPEMSVSSLASWEAQWARGWRPSGQGFVFVVDEAGKVGSDVWARVQDRVAAMGGKLIAVGDPEQGQPVSASNAWLAVEAETGSIVIDRVRRQENATHRARTEAFATGGGAAAIRGYADDGHVLFVDSVEAAIVKLAEAYYASGTSAETRIALAYTNADVASLNAAIRAEAVRRGLVDAATIRGYGTAEGKDGPRELIFGVGDRVSFQSANRELGVARNTFGTVIRTADGGIRVRLDGAEAREVDLEQDDIADLDYGYATTIHRSQGMTVDWAVTLAHGYMDRHMLYVAMSRHIKGAELVVPRTRIDGIEPLERLATRSRYQSLEARRLAPAPAAQFGADASTLLTPAAGASSPASSGSPTSGDPVRFEDDAYLAGILGRVMGLLSAGDRDAEVDDPREYAKTPTRVIDDLIAHHAVFGAEDVAMGLMQVTREPDTFARLFREALAHPDLLRLTDERAGDGPRLYTTRAHLELELKVMDRAVRLAFDGHGKNNKLDARLFKGLAEERGLTREQVEALRFASTGSRLSIISGGSGAGKTYLAGALADLHTRQDHDVIAVSPTGRGVDNLRAEGAVRSLTLKGLELLVREKEITLDANSVILLDEAGQLDAQTADGFLGMVEETGARLIAFTDTDQIGPWGPGPMFRTLEARIGSVELGASQRQRDPELRDILKQLGDHQSADTAIERLDRKGVFRAGQGRARAIEKLAKDYVSDKSEDKIVVAHTRRDVAAINAAIREQLDTLFPERAADVPATAEEGSIAALRPGDRIRLTDRYKKAHLRVGTEAVVESRSRKRVVLRVGSDEDARYLRLKNTETEFQYDFAFAGTIPGAKGRGVDSVHMLASPGLTRRLLHTGAALSQSELNIVVPVPKERVLSAMTAISRRDDTTRAALDYGFDVSARAREVIRAQRGADRPAPGALMDGLDRTLGWLADSLDGGEKGVREQAPARRRLDSLRRGVMVELMDTYRSDTGERLRQDDRQALEARIDQLVFGRGWRRFIGEGWAVRAFEAETERGYIPGVARADQMIDRVLKRGVEMAGATGEDELRDWFARAEAGMAQVIDQQKAAYAKYSRKPAQPAPAPQPPTPKAPVTPADIRHRDYRGLALQLAQAISERIPRSDPVHTPDQVQRLEEMLREADRIPGSDPGETRPDDSGKRCISNEDLLRLLPHVSWTTPETHRLGQAAAQAMAIGPLMDRLELLTEREAVFRHLDRPDAPMVKAKDFVPRLKVFTLDEVFALHEPDAPWPDSLPARMPLERAVISTRLREYGDDFEKEKKMDRDEILRDLDLGMDPGKVRDDILKDLMLGDLQPARLDEMKAAFSADEIVALRVPSVELPDSLPALDPAVRQVIADTFKQAVENRKTDSDGAGQAAPAEVLVPKIEMPPEPKLDPEKARVRDLALSLSSAVSQHVREFNPIHETDVQERIEELLSTPTGALKEGLTPDLIAEQIAYERLENDIRREVLKKLDMEDRTDEVIYGNKEAVFLMSQCREKEFDEMVNVELEDRISSGGAMPNKFDRAIGEIYSRANADDALAETIGEALILGVPQEASELRMARQQRLEGLAAGRDHIGHNIETYVRSLFEAFSHREVEALLKDGGALPTTLPELDATNRVAVARALLAVFSHIKGSQNAPALERASTLFKRQVRDLGLDQGPSHGPSL